LLTAPGSCPMTCHGQGFGNLDGKSLTALCEYVRIL
jgi:hypothetical protein